MDATTRTVHKMANIYRRFCEAPNGCKQSSIAALHAKRPRLFLTMVQAAAADMELSDCQRAVFSQQKAVNAADLALDIAIARAREIYADDADAAGDPSLIAAAERLVEETDSLDALRHDRDIAHVAQLLWMREAKLMIAALSKK